MSHPWLNLLTLCWSISLRSVRCCSWGAPTPIADAWFWLNDIFSLVLRFKSSQVSFYTLEDSICTLQVHWQTGIYIPRSDFSLLLWDFLNWVYTNTSAFPQGGLRVLSMWILLFFFCLTAIVMSIVTLDQSHSYATRPRAIRHITCAQLPHIVDMLAPAYNLSKFFCGYSAKQSRLRKLIPCKSCCY